MITDPFFYAVAIPAVIMVGLSKGGFGGAMALLGVTLMALAISPVQAAAILLPILIVMDIVSLWSWRGNQRQQNAFHHAARRLASASRSDGQPQPGSPHRWSG
jgi:uncharacterized membrane protein YfcA